MPEFTSSAVGALVVAWTTVGGLDPELDPELDPDLDLDPEPASRFLRGRRLIRHAIAARVETDGSATPAGDIVIASRCRVCGGEHGAPVILNAPLVVSLSHAGPVSVAVVANTTDVAAIGIDLEAREQSAERREAITTLTGAGHDDPVRHWTRVEAVLKADGRGLRVDPALVTVRATGPGQGDMIGRIAGDEHEYQLYDVEGPPGHVTSIAMRGPRESSGSRS